jgi:hypothetical protein
MASVVEWIFLIIVPLVMARLIWLANTGKFDVINRIRHPGVYWWAICSWGLLLLVFLVFDIALVATKFT